MWILLYIPIPFSFFFYNCALITFHLFAIPPYKLCIKKHKLINSINVTNQDFVQNPKQNKYT